VGGAPRLPAPRAPMSVHAVVLAAGAGRRMGGAKHLLRVGAAPGTPMLECVLRALSELPRLGVELGGPTVVLSEGDALGARCARHCGVRAVYARAGEGRAASVRAGVAAVPAVAEGILFALADQPLLRGEDFAALVRGFAGEPGRIAAASYGGQRGTPVLFASRYREELLALRGSQGGRELIRAHPDALLEVPICAARGRDVDRPEDLAALADSPL